MEGENKCSVRATTTPISSSAREQILKGSSDGLPLEDVPKKSLLLDGHSLTPEILARVGVRGSEIWDGHSEFSPELADDIVVDLTDIAWQRVRDSEARIRAALQKGEQIYGVTTGFGAFCNSIMPEDKLDELQVNLIRSHAAGVGKPLTPSRTKRLAVVRANVLSKGYSGLREQNLRKFINIINANCLPYVPERGSVGCSGDLAPSAHLALGAMGEGLMWHPKTKKYEMASEVLKEFGLEPIVLSVKEGLAMINGTQLMSSLTAEGVVRTRLIALQADVIAAVTMEALRAVPDAFQAIVHQIRGQQGQVDSAERIRLMIHNANDPSDLFMGSLHNVQDAYSIRCTPQVHGIVNDTLDFVANIIRREINAATDNPLVLDDGNVVSAGNFHGEYPGKAADYLAIGVSELATISERRLERLINCTLSGPTSDTGHHLPPFLMPGSSEGLNSGFMIPQCTAAALVSQNKVLCHPSTVDSVSTSAAQEDHVSMGTYAAIKVLEVIENVERVLAIELMAACQALDLVKPALKPTKRVSAVHALVRTVVPTWIQDRIAYVDMANVFKLVREGKILEAARISPVRLSHGGWGLPSPVPPPLSQSVAAAQSPLAPETPPADIEHTHFRLCLHNATLVLYDASQSPPKVVVKKNHSLLVDDNGKISQILPEGPMRRTVVSIKRAGGSIEREVECNGRAVLPGLVDCHTHAVFSGDRGGEFSAKLAGESYQSITARGGGIHFTVQATRKASERELVSSLQKRLDAMLLSGTTTVEIKSGYGLDTETELKMLRAIHTVSKTHPISIISTFCGAHAAPAGSTPEKATEIVINEMLPKVQETMRDGSINPSFCDVFCDDGFFTPEQTKRILEAAKKIGLRPSFHGDELSPQKSGVLAKEVSAVSVSHCEHLTEEDIKSMAEANVVGVLLPTTAFVLRLEPPPARKMIDSGVRVALGSDFNPNAPTLSMPTVMNMAAVMMRMTPDEVLLASTLNSAAALSSEKEVGSIDVGKEGDLMLLSGPKWDNLIYLGMGGMEAGPVGADLDGAVSTDGGPIISEIFKAGRSVVFSGKVQECSGDVDGSLVEDKRKVGLVGLHGMPDLSVLAKGIPLDPLPPPEKVRDPSVPHAPRRAYQPTEEETVQAICNALRYFPEHLHALLAPEFRQELIDYGHIYMYRFRPKGEDMPAIKAWPIETYPVKCERAASIMHMIMNNLDPEVAQFPHELVTYGGNGSVFSNWAQFWLTMHYLSNLTDSQTLILCSGHPQGLFPSELSAPRLVITNGMMVPHYSNDKDYERAYYLGVSQYGQMTAGSFCYIGPQGIVHGTTLTLLNAGRKYLDLDGLKGKVFVSSGLGGMSGAQPKASQIVQAIGVIAEVSEAALAKRHRQGWISERVDGDLDKLVDRIRECKKKAETVSIGFLGNIVDVWERLADIAEKEGEMLVDLGSDQTSCHNPYGGGYYPVGLTLEEAERMMSEKPDEYREVVHKSLRRQMTAINRLAKFGLKFWDYGNSFLYSCSRAGADVFPEVPSRTHTFRYPSYVEDIMGGIFSLGFGPFRWVCTSGSPDDLKKTDQIAARVIKDLMESIEHRLKGDIESAEKEYLKGRLGHLNDNLLWIQKAASHKLVVGSQARILYSDFEGRKAIATAFNYAVASGQLSGPVVLSRDHHDVSGTDSPFRETNDISDGSRPCADMSVQNCVGLSFRGATWVALHNGGGTGWGEAMNGGFGFVLDGSSYAATRIDKLLHWDVYNGVTRRAWAGNCEAQSNLQGMLSYPGFYPTVSHRVDRELASRVCGGGES